MNSLYSKLSTVLGQFLKDRDPKIESPPSNTQPLFLLLSVKPDLVGFATLDGQPEKNFSKAFQKFKDLYSLYSSKWSNFDLTLILCKKDTQKVTDDFCNQIELDTYFCRKFVIDLGKNLNVELGRLPFIPLRPENIVGLKRPISAQTFLMKHGVTSELAKYLVVPHVRGIERIIEECAKGDLGNPIWSKAKTNEFIESQPEVKQKVRLKELTISNFRAFRKTGKFDLDADIVILYGPNGLGKTSFFDGIDFVCTGGVARFDERFRRKTDRLLNALKHLDSSLDNSFVKATLLIDDKEVSLERIMSNRTQAYVRGISKNRTETLMNLTGLSEKPPDLRIENLVRLFRATHLFGQEYQFLTSKLREYSVLPEDTVSRMLAFQDYVEAIHKTGKVSEKLRKQIKEKESEMTVLKNSLESKKTEMKRLTQSVKIIEKPEAILAIGKKIAKKITRETTISMQIKKTLNPKMVREWRALITGQIDSLNRNLEVIEKLEIEFPELVNRKKDFKERTLRSEQKKILLNKVNKDYNKKKKIFDESNKILKKMFLDENNLISRKDNLYWLLQAKKEYKQIKTKMGKERNDYQNTEDKSQELLEIIDELKSQNNIAEETIETITTEIKILKNTIEDLGSFEENVNDWLKATNLQKNLNLYLQKSKEKHNNLKNDIKIRKKELNAALLTQSRLEKRVNNLQRSQSDLRTLLDKIEKHILDNICPVCGTSHISQEELIKKLKSQRGVQPKQLQDALRLLENAQHKTEELNKFVDELQLKIEQQEQKSADTKKDLRETNIKIKNYAEKATSLDLPGASKNLTAIINSKETEFSEKIKIKKKKLSKQKSKIPKLQEKLNNFIKQQKTCQKNLLTCESRQIKLQAKIDEIRNKASAHRLSLDLGRKVIQNELSNIDNLIKDIQKQIDIQQTKNQSIEKEVGTLSEKKNDLNSQIQELNKEILHSRKYIKEVEKLIIKLNLTSDVNINQIVNLRKNTAESLLSLDLLKNEILNFEIAISNVGLSASLVKIQQDMEDAKKQRQDIEKEREQLNAWQLYFEIICKELESLQKKALKEYTEKYGPLTSTIQRRLRPVYGFGDIELSPEKGGIAVRVKRKEEKNIQPSDFFSESQIQTVMISLFLSASLTQTWSSFAPILLDDPVKHFDDLNSYSLLDLIRGLIKEPAGRHQFIISTCEERLFRLMRQKFSKMNHKIIFYIFESIGENGPEFKRI